MLLKFFEKAWVRGSRNPLKKNMLLVPHIGFFFGIHPVWHFFSQSQSIRHSGAALFVRWAKSLGILRCIIWPQILQQRERRASKQASSATFMNERGASEWGLLFFLSFSYATSPAPFSKGEFGGRAIYVTWFVRMQRQKRWRDRKAAATGFVPRTKGPDPRRSA